MFKYKDEIGCHTALDALTLLTPAALHARSITVKLKGSNSCSIPLREFAQLELAAHSAHASTVVGELGNSEWIERFAAT